MIVITNATVHTMEGRGTLRGLHVRTKKETVNAAITVLEAES
jgi:hypothetical protein